MMDKLLKEIAPVVAHETQRASEQYGDKYASAHEALRLLQVVSYELSQEAQETIQEFNSLNSFFQKHGYPDNGDNLKNLSIHALNAAAEAIQVAAVCEKIARGFEK
jgi:hypothetical protein